MEPTIPVDAIRALARLSRGLERSLDGLSLAQYRVLARVASGDERAARIADRLALGKPAISATVESLRQRGLLRRAGVDDDRRATALRLTEEGAAVLVAAERAMADWLGAIAARTPDPAGTIATLAALQAALEEHRDERAATARVTR
jgi:DNA-binding MarR family transcriptional regulator